MLVMTFKIHKLSKKYGDTTFIFFIVFLMISSFFFQLSFNSFISDGFETQLSSILMFYIQLFISLITIHLLIGKRLLYIRKHTIKNKEDLMKKDFNNINNLVYFIHIMKNENYLFNFLSTTDSNQISNINSINMNAGDTISNKGESINYDQNSQSIA